MRSTIALLSGDGAHIEVAASEGPSPSKANAKFGVGEGITGRVVDEFGEPVADAQVAPMRSANQGGRRRMMPSGRASMTNDIGEFRIFGLPPGQYVISATLRAGMILAPQQRYSVGEQMRRILRMAGDRDPAEMRDQVEFLSRWV